MTTGSRFVLPFWTIIDMIGGVLPGAKFNFYASGTDTRLATYNNRDLDPIHANPNPVVADAGGRFSNIFLQMRDYKVVLTDANDDEIWTADPVSPFIDTVGDITAYDMPIYMGRKPEDGEVYPRMNILRDCFLPVDLEGGLFTIETTSLPTLPFVITLHERTQGVLGTITFAVDGAPTVSFPDKINFSAGDQFWPSWPTPQDATGQDVTLGLPFTLGS